MAKFYIAPLSNERTISFVIGSPMSRRRAISAVRSIAKHAGSRVVFLLGIRIVIPNA